MHPHLVPHIAVYPLFLTLGVCAGVLVGTWRLAHSGLGPWRSFGLELLLAASGLVGAKLYAICERGHVLSLWTELTGSYRYPGGIIGAALVFVVFHRRLLQGMSLGTFADAIAPATGIALAIVRLGCFAHGCCFGRATGVPWAPSFPAHSTVWNSQLAAGQIAETAVVSLPVHPLQLYFAAASLGLALFVWWLGRHSVPGRAALVFLALDGIVKLGLETLRGEPMAHLQLFALATAAAAGSVLLVSALSYSRDMAAGRMPGGVIRTDSQRAS